MNWEGHEATYCIQHGAEKPNIGINTHALGDYAPPVAGSEARVLVLKIDWYWLYWEKWRIRIHAFWYYNEGRLGEDNVIKYIKSVHWWSSEIEVLSKREEGNIDGGVAHDSLALSVCEKWWEDTQRVWKTLCLR